MCYGAAMAIYSVRIQLQGADSSDYYPLWQALEKLGFKDHAPAGKKKFALPTGVYIFVGEQTGEQVRDLALKAASAADTGHKPKILVTESTRMWAFGLDEYKTDDELLQELFKV
jgi:hypothetical protein